MDQKAFWRDVVYLFVAKILQKKVVYQVHGGALPDQFFPEKGILNSFLNRVLHLPDVVVILAEIERESYQNFKSIKRLTVIPNAIFLDLFERVSDKNFEQKNITLVYLGALQSFKGLFEAVEAVDIVWNRMTINNFNFLIAGSGPAEQALRHRVKYFGLENVIKFIGNIFEEEKKQFWRNAHLFIFPTYAEGMPYTLLESIASGTPIITTRVGGIPDVIINSIHGFFVEPKDVNGLADAIKKLITNRQLMRNMSSHCIKRAKEYYGMERLVEQFSQCYNEILKN
jgi:glycosyltransferase involved in cell wall biosynthesis